VVSSLASGERPATAPGAQPTPGATATAGCVTLGSRRLPRLARALTSADSGDDDRDGVAARRAHAARYTGRAGAEATVDAYRKALD